MEFNDYGETELARNILLCFSLHVLSQSSGVNGSILIVCAIGGSR